MNTLYIKFLKKQVLREAITTVINGEKKKSVGRYTRFEIKIIILDNQNASRQNKLARAEG